MVIKMKTPPRPTEPETDSNEDSPPASADPLRGVSSTAGGHISKDRKSTEVEFSRLKNLVPSISKKNTVSKLDVILEAIRYIDQLQGQLVEQIQEQRIHPSVASEFLTGIGKENQTNSSTALKMKLKASLEHQTWFVFFVLIWLVLMLMNWNPKKPWARGLFQDSRFVCVQSFKQTFEDCDIHL